MGFVLCFQEEKDHVFSHILPNASSLHFILDFTQYLPLLQDIWSLTYRVCTYIILHNKIKVPPLDPPMLIKIH